MIELRKAFAGLSEAERSEAAKAIAGQEAMAGFLAVVNASDADFNKMTAAVDSSDGAAAKMAKTMNDNAKGALKAFKSAIEEIEIIVGNAFLDALKDATKGVTNFVQEFGKFAKEHPKLVGGIAAAIAVIGGLLVALGSVGLAVSAISTAFGALAPIFTAVGSVLSVGLAPILAILGAIASVIYFVGENWETVVSWFQPGIDSMMDGIAQLQSAWENLQPFIAAITPLLQAIATVIGGAIVGAVSLLWRMFTAAFNAIAGLINWVAGLLGGLGDTIQWIAGGLAGLIDKAAQFIGMKGQIASTNESMVQGWLNRGSGGGTVNNSQTNYNTFTNPNQWGATNEGNNAFFAYE
jgi:phage-related protein